YRGHPHHGEVNLVLVLAAAPTALAILLGLLEALEDEVERHLVRHHESLPAELTDLGQFSNLVLENSVRPSKHQVRNDAICGNPPGGAERLRKWMLLVPRPVRFGVAVGDGGPILLRVEGDLVSAKFNCVRKDCLTIVRHP